MNKEEVIAVCGHDKGERDVEGVGLLQRDRGSTGKGLRVEEKSQVVESSLPGVLGYTAQPPHWRETGELALAPTPQTPKTQIATLPTCSLCLPYLSLSSPVPTLAALAEAARKLRGLTLR